MRDHILAGILSAFVAALWFFGVYGSGGDWSFISGITKVTGGFLVVGIAALFWARQRLPTKMAAAYAALGIVGILSAQPDLAGLSETSVPLSVVGSSLVVVLAAIIYRAGREAQKAA